MTIRKTLTSIVLAGALALGVVGCSKDNNSNSAQPKAPASVGEVSNYFRSSPRVATGDLNGDEQNDIVVGAYDGTQGTITAMVNNGEGNYTPKVIANVPQYFRSAPSVSIADMNNDGRNDVVVGAYDGNSGKVYVFLNKGDMNFSEK